MRTNKDKQKIMRNAWSLFRRKQQQAEKYDTEFNKTFDEFLTDAHSTFKRDNETEEVKGDNITGLDFGMMG